MSTTLYYFSATGNSLVVARDLASEFNDVRLIPITKALELGSEEQADTIGKIGRASCRERV